VGATQFHGYRRTDMKKVIVAFRNFARAPKKEWENVILIKNLLCYNKLSNQPTPGDKELVNNWSPLNSLTNSQLL